MTWTNITADCGHEVRVSGRPGPDRRIRQCDRCLLKSTRHRGEYLREWRLKRALACYSAQP